MITRKQAETILAIALQSPGADELFISLGGSSLASRGLAGTRLQPPQRMENLSMSVTARLGRRYAAVSGNLTDESDIRALVARAAAHAAEMPEAPEVLPFPGAAEQTPETGLSLSASGNAVWEQLEQTAMEFGDAAAAKDHRAFGSVSFAENVLALASSNGLFLYHPSTLAHAQFRCFSADGRSTGFGEAYTHDPAALRPADVLHEAVETCAEWRDPVAIEAKRLTTVFEPRALADMLKPMLRQFSSRAIAGDQSFLRRLDGSSFLGSTLFDTRVTLYSDPRDARLPSMPFTTEGETVGKEYWVKEGVISQIAIDRYEANASGIDPVAPPTNLIMDVAQPVRDIVAETEYGLLVRGFANLNILDPKNCLLSGSTRDGLFLIENGKITKPVRNLVMRETPVYLFKELIALGEPVRTSTTGGYFPMHLPPIAVKDVMYTLASGLV